MTIPLQYSQQTLLELKDRCRSLDKMIERGAIRNRKEFMLEVKDNPYEKVYLAWYNMNVEPEEWLKQCQIIRRTRKERKS